MYFGADVLSDDRCLNFPQRGLTISRIRVFFKIKKNKIKIKEE
jgi:hypothetical protein